MLWASILSALAGDSRAAAALEQLFVAQTCLRVVPGSLTGAAVAPTTSDGGLDSCKASGDSCTKLQKIFRAFPKGHGGNLLWASVPLWTGFVALASDAAALTPEAAAAASDAGLDGRNASGGRCMKLLSS